MYTLLMLQDMTRQGSRHSSSCLATIPLSNGFFLWPGKQLRNFQKQGGVCPRAVSGLQFAYRKAAGKPAEAHKLFMTVSGRRSSKRVTESL